MFLYWYIILLERVVNNTDNDKIYQTIIQCFKGTYVPSDTQRKNNVNVFETIKVKLTEEEKSKINRLFN